MLTLSVPKLRVKGPRAGEMRPSRLQAWLDDLPQGNQEDSMHQIQQALFVQNRADLEPTNRLTLMELYRDPVLNIVESLAQHYVSAPFPMTERQFNLASAVQRLLEELANGYKVVANDLMTSDSTRKHVTEFVLAVQRATDTLGTIVARCCEIYRPYPDEAWRQLHQLYRLSEMYEVLHHPVEQGAGRGNRTVFDAYERVLLIGACNPYGLHQGECLQLFELIPGWRRHVRISSWKGSGKRKEPGDLLINLASDSPPLPLIKVPDEELDPQKSDHYRIVRTLDVVREVHSIMTDLAAASPQTLPGPLSVGSGTNVDLPRRFGRVLAGVNITRRSNRSSYNREIPICVGMNSIHFFTNGQRTFQAPEPPKEKGRPFRAAANEEFFDLSDPSVGESRQEDECADTGPADLKLYSNIHRLFTCSVKDQGANSVCVEFHNQNELYVRVGDLIGLQFPTPNKWSVGVIRWLKGLGAGSVEFVVELLAPELYPVAVKRAVEGDSFFQALMLPGNRSLKQPQSLLVPRGAYHPGEKLILSREPGEHMEISPLQVMERTGSYDQLVVMLPAIRSPRVS